ncbi:MAG: immunoglobulin domain-containing protein, partial [Candidatus Sulfotelmatobacter sp.]
MGVSKPGDGVTGSTVTAPTITTQPTSQTVIAGETATFSVTAAGTGPLNYQWQKGTAPVTGATSASYTTAATTTADSGSQFSVVVSNSAGRVTSKTATLTVNPPPAVPSITQQPSNQTVTAGQTATFSVMAVGVAPLSYQWQKGTTAINGATSASYTTLPTTTANNGSQFTVVVSNVNGNVTSSAATLTVNATTTPATINVLTYHNDVARTGQNLAETTLTTSNVNSAKFGKLGFYSTDGLVDAQPLYASSVAVPANGTHNILIIATEHG